MRILLQLFVLSIGFTVAHAQRPWLLRSTNTAGPNPKVVSAAGSVYVFDTVAIRSFDHGVTWTNVASDFGHVSAISDFISGVTLMLTYDQQSRVARFLFSQGGTSWEAFDSLSNASRPIDIATASTEWYFITESGTELYRYSEKLETLPLPSGSKARNIIVAQNKIILSDASKGILISADRGATWTTLAVEGAGSLHSSPQGAFIASSRGVAFYNFVSERVSYFGKWPGKTTSPRVLDVDTYLNSVLAISDEGGYQMYRLESDSTWLPIGYPLPGNKAAITNSIFTIDAGYAILGHAIYEGFTDSAGVYVYDLNDFSDVKQEQTSNEELMTVRGALISFSAEVTDVTSVDVFTITGQMLSHFDCSTLVPRSLPLPAAAVGAYYVVANRSAHPPLTRMFLR